MKGKLVLTSVTNPHVGKKVVWNGRIWQLNGKGDKGSNGYQENFWLVGNKHENISYEPISAFNQIAIKHSYNARCADSFDLEVYPNTIYYDLHPEQWDWALAFIGSELEFTVEKGYAQQQDSEVELEYVFANINIPTPVTPINDVPQEKPITGEDVAALLSGIHTHGELIFNRLRDARHRFKRSSKREQMEAEEGKIYYSEEDLLPILKALGLPEPIWKYDKSLEEWLKERS